LPTTATSDLRHRGGVELSVVLACLNGATTLSRQLDALLGQRVPSGVNWELVVADNGSIDQSPAIVRDYQQEFFNVRAVDCSQRPGLAYARNAGVAASHGAALAFCDQDDEVAPGWLAAMVDALRRNDFVAGRLEHDRLNPGWTIVVRGRPQEDRLMELAEVPSRTFAFGCTIGVARRLHDEVGGFDEAFGTGCEDVDYCWRLQQAGHVPTFVPEAVTHYRYRSDLAAIFRQARRYGASEAHVYAKHRRLGLAPMPHPVRRGLREWLAALKAALLVRDRATLGIALWRLGLRTGRLAGSIQFGIWFL
jgi:glycosyltransferase involved in cell wall biosynthesis